MNEAYYYGQGKVYLARRDGNGRPGAWRWVGDVSALTVTLAFEQKTAKVSRGGKLVNTRRYLTSHSGSVTSRWHSFSPDNLALLLNSTVAHNYPELIENETLPSNISAGDRISLAYQNVWGVGIHNMVEGRDYRVDAPWGMIEFITTPTNQPVRVNYAHAPSSGIPIFTDKPNEFALRFESINLADSSTSMLLELYRLSFDPLTALQLINNESSLGGIDTAAEIMYDLNRVDDPNLGRFGRVTVIRTLSGIRHNGAINYDGRYLHGGN
ncbi:hypothetical protein GVN99_13755 [Serratia marcescens]|uniref:phage tail tube protein n=1 Tax=Serratia TaxID=613 RepID=UPI0007455D63|nr:MULTISPECIES: hypothetical protein [Serratia]MBI6154258.1 hypothetical protein [Serratia surfactantfaciens]MDI9108623.1 hypothetical protein [Serratia marcescens]NSM20182.1 hypothetical protein [Serratia marcescens]NSM49085.1 hypothetical protein [Serratia marcescens]CVC81286.1 Uncharacterised protein [Serratia marcescens]